MSTSSQTQATRHELEKSFVEGIIDNTLRKYEQYRSLPDGPVSTISRLARYRVNVVVNKLEKSLSKKALEFHAMRSQPAVAQNRFVDDIIFALDIIHDILQAYVASIKPVVREKDNNCEELSKYTCRQLISTVGGVVYFQSQFQENSNSRRLCEACGNIIHVISAVNEECTLFHTSQLLKQCIDPYAESRGSFFTLQTLQYMRLKTKGILVLFSLLSNVIDHPTNSLNPNFGKWKKSAMLELSAPLRVCILKWLEFDSAALPSLMGLSASNEDNPNMLALYNKFEPWANGAKRKSAVWPLMCLFLSLMPCTFSNAVNDTQKKSATARVLRKTVENLNVSAMRSVLLQKDSVLNTELSVISIVLMLKVAASLQRSLLYSDSYGRLQDSVSHIFCQSGGSQELPNKHMDELRTYLMPNVDRVRECLFLGNCPSHIYYNAITEKVYPGMVCHYADDKDRDHGALCFECEHSQEYLLNSFFWSLFYVDQAKYLHLMSHIHSNATASFSVSGFARIHSIRSLNSILSSDYLDHAGSSPSWTAPAAANIRVLILNVLGNAVCQHLDLWEINDLERCLLSEKAFMSNLRLKNIVDESGPKEKQESNEMLREVLTIFLNNSWFVFDRRISDDSTDEPSSLGCSLAAEIALLLRDVASVIRFIDDDSLSSLAEEAFISLLEPRFMSLWNPEDPFMGVLTVHSIVLKHLSYLLLQCKASEHQVSLRLLSCVNHLFNNCNIYIEEDQLLRDVSFSTSNMEIEAYCIIQQAIWVAEGAMLLHLCSSDMNIIQQTLSCLEKWCVFVEFVAKIDVPALKSFANEEDDENKWNKLDNFSSYYFKIKSSEYHDVILIYSELSSCVGAILSQKLQQKNIRTFLHNMPCRTLGMSWAILAVIQRWEEFNDSILSCTTSSIPDHRASAFDEWTNHTGFLCTMSRAILDNISQCSIDSLAVYIGGNDGYLRNISKNSVQDFSLSNSVKPPTCTRFIRQLLYLILIPHDEKRISYDVFFSIGLSLSAQLVPHLFRELYVIIKIVSDVLATRCDACVTTPISGSQPSVKGTHRSRSPPESPRNSRSFDDFEVLIGEMQLKSILNFVYAILTMLQMIFDRDWQPFDSIDAGEGCEVVDETGAAIGGSQLLCLVEKMIFKFITIESKLHRQLEIGNTADTRSSIVSPSISSRTNPANANDDSILEQFRLRKKVAHMFETFFSQLPESSAFDSSLQMRLIFVIIDWLHDCVGYLASTTRSAKKHLVQSKRSVVDKATSEVESKESIALYQSTQLACIKALHPMLKGFELVAYVESDEDREFFSCAHIVPQAAAKSAQQHTKEAQQVSKSFFRAFHVMHEMIFASLSGTNDSAVVTRKVTIDCLCSLLHANTGIGLKHVIEAVNTSDSQHIRCILLNVFADVLSRRIDLNFDENKQATESYEDCLSELVNLIIAPNCELLRLLSALTKSGKDASTLASSLLKLFGDSPGRDALDLLEWAIHFELLQTPRLGSLFRSETLSTKLMGGFFSSNGFNYLRETLHIPVKRFLEDNPDVEIDVHKGVDPDDVIRNAVNLLKYADIFLQSIVSTADKCPSNIKHVLCVLREESLSRFASVEASAECERVSIAGYMFLRFFCPAIAMPIKHDLVSATSYSGDDSRSDSKDSTVSNLSRQASRGLLLVAKVLQNLANGAHFLEESMSPLNNWIDQHAHDIMIFTSKVSFSRQRTDSDQSAQLAESRNKKDSQLQADSPPDELIAIHTYLYNNRERIEKLLSSNQNVSAAAEHNDDSRHSKHNSSIISRQSSLGALKAGSDRSLDIVVKASSVEWNLENGLEYDTIRSPLKTLLQKLGEPPDTSEHSSVVNKRHPEEFSITTRKAEKSSDCSHFMADFESRGDSMKALQSVQDSMIFYSSNHYTPKSGDSHEIFFFVARRVTSETDPTALIYFILVELQRFIDTSSKDKDGHDPEIDIVIDSSSFNSGSVLPMWSYASFWGKIKSLVGGKFGKFLKKVYVMYPSVVLLMSAQKILKKWGLKTKSVAERVEFCTPSQLISKHSHLQDKIPSSTINIESTSLKHWPAVFQQQNVTVTISSKMLLVHSRDKFGGIEFTRTDMLFLHLIESIIKSSSRMKSRRHSSGSTDKSGKKRSASSSKWEISSDEKKESPDKKNSSSDQLVVINYTGFNSKRSLKLHIPNYSQFVSALSIALTQVRQQRALEEASESAGTESIHPDSILGNLLHVALLNMFSENSATRKAAFSLLCQVKETYDLPLPSLPPRSIELSSLFVPSSLVQYCTSISSELASLRPECGRDFLLESFGALKRQATTQSQKIAIVRYLSPWYPFLGVYLEFIQERDGMSDERFSSHTCGSITSDPEDNTHANCESVQAIGRGEAPHRRQSHVDVSKHSVGSGVDDNVGDAGALLCEGNESKVDVKFEYLGSRVTATASSSIIEDIECLFEIALSSEADDKALSNVLHNDFWENVAQMAEVSSLAAAYLTRQLSCEALRQCSRTSRVSDAGNSTKSVKWRNETEDSAAGCSILVAPMQFDGLSTSDTLSSSSSSMSAFSVQGNCAYCATICEVATILLTRYQDVKQPISICMLVVDKIKELAECAAQEDIKSAESTASIDINTGILDSYLEMSGSFVTEQDSNSKSDDLPCAEEGGNETGNVEQIVPESNLRRNLESFFSLPVPHSPSTAPQKPKKASSFKVRTLPKPPSSVTPKTSQFCSKWTELVYLIRPLLHGIFNNLNVLTHCTPAILHVAVLLLTKGPRSLRPGFLITISSLVHALCAEHTDDMAEWKDVVSRLESPDYHQIFNKNPELTSSHLELVMKLVADIGTSKSLSCSNWKHSLWIKSQESLNKFYSFTICNSEGLSNDIRAQCPMHSSFYYLMGNLVSESTVTDDFLNSLLKSFREVVKLCGEYDFTFDNKAKKRLDEVVEQVLFPMFFCLGRSVKFVGIENLKKMFWATILMVQSFPDHYLSGPVALLQQVVDELLRLANEGAVGMHESRSAAVGSDKKTNISHFLLRSVDEEESNLSEVMSQAYKTGLSFCTSFSTALTSTLSRCLVARDSKTKSISVDILQKMLFHDQETYSADGNPNECGVSGYCPVLMPHLALEESSVSRAPVVVNSKSFDDDAKFDSHSHFSQDTNAIESSIQSKSVVPTYLASLCQSVESQLVTPTFFGEHNFPTEKSKILFVVSLLSYLRLLSHSAYSDEEQQSHSFAFVVLLQSIREFPVVLRKLYHIVFTELTTAYKVNLNRNQHLADAILEVIHECLLSRLRPAHCRPSSGRSQREDSDIDDHTLLSQRNNLTIKARSQSVEGNAQTLVSKLKATILDKDINKQEANAVNVMQEDVVFDSEDEDRSNHSAQDRSTPISFDANAHYQDEAVDMDYLSEIGFAGLLAGPFGYYFQACSRCYPGNVSCSCRLQRLENIKLFLSSMDHIIDSMEFNIEKTLQSPMDMDMGTQSTVE